MGPSRAALIDGSLSTYTPGRSGAPPLPSPIGRLLRWARTLRGGGQAANAGIAVVRVTRGMLAQEPRFIVLFRAARKRVAAMEVRFVERSMTPNCVPSSRSMRPGARYLGAFDGAGVERDQGRADMVMTMSTGSPTNVDSPFLVASAEVQRNPGQVASASIA